MIDEPLAYFSDEYFKKQLECTLNDIKNQYKPCNKPKAVLLGGQSGAGKTTIHKILLGENKNRVIIDGDSYRTKHPNNKLLDKKYREESVTYKSGFSNKMVENLISKLSSQKKMKKKWLLKYAMIL